jgi:hypothetical protein
MQVSGFDYRLHAGADLKRAAGIEEVTLHGAAGDPDELTDIRGALALLRPVEALQLAH